MYVCVYVIYVYTYVIHCVPVSISLCLLIHSFTNIYISIIESTQHIISGSSIQSVRRTGKYLWSLEARQSTLDRPDKEVVGKRGEVKVLQHTSSKPTAVR